VRYRVAVALSYIGDVEAATEAFRWVVQHADAKREETRLAREWLAAREQPSAAPRGETAAPDDAPTTGRLTGRADWARYDPDSTAPKLQMMLEGDETATRGRRYFTRTEMPGPYEFPKVVPGRYRLSAQVGPRRLWDLPVTVEAGEGTVLDLKPGMSSAPPDILLPRPTG
jgi:hypothetical protein